jgi:hypothetical protein
MPPAAVLAAWIFSVRTDHVRAMGLWRISDRTKQIAEKLSNTSNPPTGVIPVIFTSLIREETAVHWDTAATFRIALVERENVLGLLDSLDANILPDQLYTPRLHSFRARSLSNHSDTTARGFPARPSELPAFVPSGLLPNTKPCYKSRSRASK